ncbi:MAG TPA: primosomal protein N' [Pyrinomonadaceae bacterium]|nr:primosomal protein N' [Pyrinomonadaceae bacterium]
MQNRSGANSSLAPAYAEVAIPLHLSQTFTYRLPLSTRSEVRVGSRLLVEFGRKKVTGYVVALVSELDPAAELRDAEIKDAEELLDAEPLLTPEIMEITRWVADYYAAPWGEVLKAALPAGLNATVEQILSITSEGRDELARLPHSRSATAKALTLRTLADAGETSLHLIAKHVGEARARVVARELERVGWIRITHRARTVTAKAKRRKAVRLLPPEMHAAPDAARALTAAQRRIIEQLMAEGGEAAFADLVDRANVSASTIQTLEKRRIVETYVRDVRRDPLANAVLPEKNDLRLTEAQSDALKKIETKIDEGDYAAFLLHGVTGSGKTEIYIRAMNAALNHGRSAMMLVPEIALTPVFSRRLRAHFGDQVAIFHSSLTTGERFDEWSRLKRGEARVVIGTRSAVFAPVSDLGLIVVDEEHETSYRQHESPYYNGRDTAIVRAKKESAVVVLGSATPSLETYHNARTGKYNYLHLPNRIANRAMARAEIIDMRAVFAEKGKPIVFSEQLLKAIEETHERGEQSIILLNRRGYSSFVLCRSCGESIHCPNCDVTLTFHRSERSLVCHYCNFRRPTPSKCPNCDGVYIYFVGEGTEQIEEILKKQFPALRIARLDRDTTVRRKLFERTILEFGAGELDMLVGTQMLAKGHDFHNVTLVGVVSVDAGLALPDFRSAERTFQLITQVAGRAGRGSRAGRVLVQTFHPNHYALGHACAQDFFGFYQEEIRHRKTMSYPPFVALASLLVHGDELGRVQQWAAQLRESLDNANDARACRILGPAPAPLSRLRGEHRIQILIKSRSRPQLRKVIDMGFADAAAKGCDTRAVNIEIDPISLM